MFAADGKFLKTLFQPFPITLYFLVPSPVLKGLKNEKLKLLQRYNDIHKTAVPEYSPQSSLVIKWKLTMKRNMKPWVIAYLYLPVHLVVSTPTFLLSPSLSTSSSSAETSSETHRISVYPPPPQTPSFLLTLSIIGSRERDLKCQCFHLWVRARYNYSTSTSILTELFQRIIAPLMDGFFFLLWIIF